MAPKLQLCVFLALLNMKKLCGMHSAMQVIMAVLIAVLIELEYMSSSKPKYFYL